MQRENIMVHSRLLVIIILCTLRLALVEVASSIPLETRSRWIVDEATGRRVKLACVNWAAHLEPMVAEGLNHQPLSSIANAIPSLGFNCVRLTWATAMFTKQSLSVAQSFVSLNLHSAAAGIEVHNPGFLQLTVAQAYAKVVVALGAAGLMVVLDNHVSKAQWCCGSADGNGFFGDKYFDPAEWLRSLTVMATAFNGTPQVVAMSLRNELRGPASSAAKWLRFMRRGAAAVHAANPNVIVILSGLSYDSDLSFLAPGRMPLPFVNKIAYEVHWYAFTSGITWSRGLPNQLCGSLVAGINKRAAFLATSAPLFISEFGIDERGINENDNRYLNCFLAYAAEWDFDWALWTLQGSYYIRNQQPGFEETYGVFNSRWDGLRNAHFLSRLHPIQTPIQDPSFSSDLLYEMIYHPASGLCLVATAKEELLLGSCNGSSRWSYNNRAGGFIGVVGTSACIGIQGDGLPVVLTDRLHCPIWSVVSSSNLQIGTTDGTGKMVCLDGRSSPSVVTTDCICLVDSQCSIRDNPESQWFKVISTSRNLA